MDCTKSKMKDFQEIYNHWMSRFEKVRAVEYELKIRHHISGKQNKIAHEEQQQIMKQIRKVYSEKEKAQQDLEVYVEEKKEEMANYLIQKS